MKVTWSDRAEKRNEIIYHFVVDKQTICGITIGNNWRIDDYVSQDHTERLCSQCMLSSALVEMAGKSW